MAEPSISPSTAATPVPLRVTFAGLGALVLLHLAVPIVMLTNKASLRADTLAAHPTFTAEELDAAVVAALAAAAVFHLLFCVAYVWFGWKVARRRRWARVALTITLVLATLFSVVSWSSSAMFHTAIIAGDAVQIALLGLLWIPPSVRDFFGLSACG